MIFSSSIRRIGVTTVTTLGGIALIAGCSSSGNGHATAFLGSSTSSSASSSSSSSSSAPSSSTGGGTSSSSDDSSSASGGSDQAFCDDLKNATAEGSSLLSDPAKAVALYKQLLADAPAQIKAPIQRIYQLLQKVQNGDTSGLNTSSLTSDASALQQYAASHCMK